MVSKETILTIKGKEKIEAELEQLKTVRRKEIAARIKQAIEFGDISENSEYDEAKNEQAQIEERIMKLENLLKKAVILDEDEISTDVVGVGSTVYLRENDDPQEVKYTIVGSAEADPYELKISNESPVGKALLGNRVGDKVEIQIPDGVTVYEVIRIEKAEVL
ncbi:transcription elongation factor GreA [Anoxynatronum buryatiense]|uniref:Transcription elongation factor GreA n=1 Tax=Anoxynatronum buryatiense TaxID=489973 RepID=A0AA45WYX2_9CLOT|nr:transcription elongation factor GreA [Anoxynatronum buryatiense]SMP70214.1 transcription elongation factor GreA [Anoxynatronum buryatiense]